jgi:integrase/recombinase XerD
MIQVCDLVTAYLKSAEFSVLSPNTKRAYAHYLKKFEEVCGSQGLGASLEAYPKQNAVALPNDVALLSSVVHGFKGAQNQRMARRVLILLIGWASRYGMLHENFAKRIPVPKLTAKPRSPFTTHEVKMLEESLNDPTLPALYKPYVAQAVVAFHTGMRPTELDNLDWTDVGPEFISVRSAKHQEVGAVARMVRVTDSVISCMQTRSRGLVFNSVNGKKLNKDTRSEAIRFVCTKVGIKPREFYNTRRGTATEMFKAGYDISAIQHQLGHANISTTQIYIKPTMQQAASVFRGF